MELKIIYRAMFIAVSFVMAYFGSAHAQGVRIVNDPKSTAQVVNNYSTQILIEAKHNQELDSIRAYKEKTAQYAATMAVIAETYQYVMQNINGFGQESNYYKEIGLCSYDIVARIPKVTKAIGQSKIQQKAMCLMELANIYEHTYQLVNDFVNIVNNSKVKHPLEGGKVKKDNDGYNLLDRNARLTLANRIYTDLLKIRYRIEYLEILSQYATWSDLFFRLDSTSWANVVSGKNRAQVLILQWNRLHL